MSDNFEKKDKEVENQEEVNTYKLTLTHTNYKELENVCSFIIQKRNTKGLENAKINGVRRIPTKVLRITTRRSPCGNGTATYDKFEMRIHKRVINLKCTEQEFLKVSQLNIPAGMIVEANNMV